jgi:LytS/YehU family sensor histidine kinase
MTTSFARWSWEALTAVLFFEARERDAERRMHEERMSRVAIDKQVAEARLQLLHAQIEPHFLFNSLASVKLLYGSDAARGTSLVRNIKDYLRLAMEEGRKRETTLQQELQLVQSFLAVLKLRMGDRLDVRIDVPATLRSAKVLPLVLATLVENAVKHGLSPKGEGGTLLIEGRDDGACLELRVADDGVGFRANARTGVGLANSRARLASLYGDRGSLELERNESGGVTASLRVPVAWSAAA